MVVSVLAPPFSNVWESCDDNLVRGAGCGATVGMPTVCVNVPFDLNESCDRDVDVYGLVSDSVVAVNDFGSIESPSDRLYPV